MAEIVTFRPTPEVQEILLRAKEEGTSMGSFINRCISTANTGTSGAFDTRFLFYPELAEAELYRPEKTDMPVGQAVAMYSAPVGQLSPRRYSNFKTVLRNSGMDYFYFRLNADHVIGIVSSSKEEASIEFAKYFVQDPVSKEYVRTMLPLPQVRYDHASHVVIVVTKEQKL